MQSDDRYNALGHVSLSEDESIDHEQAAMSAEEDLVFDYPHFHFSREIMGAELPHDSPAQGAFDNRFDFVIGDSGAHFGGVHKCEYATSGAKGMPHWTALFRFFWYILNMSGVRTLFLFLWIIVISRSPPPQETLSHWPMVEAWWKSRLAMY